MYLKRARNLQEHGDTIVEVIISIAVISLVIVGAYVVTNSSLNETIASQERLSATQLAGQQIEQLDDLAANDPTNSIFNAAVPAPFCLTNTQPPASQQEPVSVVVIPDPSLCVVKTNGESEQTVPFTISITRSVNGNSTTNTFTTEVTWTGPDGADENIDLIYRVYPE
jgi:Tfp pilus assembly protein PilV